jgi:glycosyltransferase involved in cell wall biosynthesis
MLTALRSVDVLLLAARDLGGKADDPLTILEAMATGRPVVVTDLPQLAGLDDAVWRVPVADLSARARPIEDLLGSPRRWESRQRPGTSWSPGAS